jgi:hypothetical protein
MLAPVGSMQPTEEDSAELVGFVTFILASLVFRLKTVSVFIMSMLKNTGICVLIIKCVCFVWILFGITTAC